MTKRIVDEALLKQVLEACNAIIPYVHDWHGGNAHKLHQAMTELRSALDGDAVGPVARQPIIKDQHGVLRFKKNGLVDALYEHGVKTGLGLNELHQMEFSDEDRQQFAQLIGYSVSSYGGLSYVTDEAPQPAQKVEPVATTPYNPTEQMRWAAKRIDPALTHEQIRALWCAMWSAAPQPAQKVGYTSSKLDLLRTAIQDGSAHTDSKSEANWIKDCQNLNCPTCGGSGHIGDSAHGNEALKKV